MQVRYNPTKRRYELVDENGQVAAAWLLEGGDGSDLDPAIVGSTDKALSDFTDQRTSGAIQQIAPGGTIPIGDTPDDIRVRASGANAATASRNRFNDMDAREQELRREIMAYGADPGRFFPAETGVGGGAITAPRSRVVGRPTADMQSALNAENEAALRLQETLRAEQLQAAENAWAAAKTGYDRMQAMQKLTTGMNEGQRNLQLAEQQLSGDPKNDRFTYIVDPSTGNPRAVHAALAGQYQQMFGAQQERDRFLQQTDPAGYAAEQEMRRKQRQPTAIPQFQDGGVFEGSFGRQQPFVPAPEPQMGEVQFKTAAQQSQEQGEFDYDVSQALAQIQQEQAIKAQQFQQASAALDLQMQQIDQQGQVQLQRIQQRRAATVAENPWSGQFMRGPQ